VIDPAVAAGLAQIAARERDVLGAYQRGFEPESPSVAQRSRMLPGADPMSVVAPEGAYFVAADAGGTLTFSRDGAFVIERGELRSSSGRPVLGVALRDRATLGPLHIDPYDAATGQALEPRVAADGTFSYARRTVEPRSGEARLERVAVGRVALARFPAGTQPERIDGVSVRAPHGVAPWVGVPADGSFTGLIPRARDLGRVDVAAGLEKLSDAYRSFEALRSANHARGSFEKTTMDLLK
jgi:flagellar basal body rod protein FlgG